MTNTKNNVKVTNVENGSVIIITKELFDVMRNHMSEDSIYQYTDEPTTMMTARNSTTDTYKKLFNSLMDFTCKVRENKIK